MSTQLATMYATLKTWEQNALSQSAPEIQNFGHQLSAAVSAFEAAVPALAKTFVNAGIEAVPFLKPVDGLVEGFADPFVVSVAQMLESHLLGNVTTASASGNDQPQE